MLAGCGRLGRRIAIRLFGYRNVRNFDVSDKSGASHRIGQQRTRSSQYGRGKWYGEAPACETFTKAAGFPQRPSLEVR